MNRLLLVAGTLPVPGWTRPVAGILLVLVAALAPAPAGAEACGGTDPQMHRFMAVMLAENPGILEARARHRSGLQRVSQAGALPDPQLSYRYFARSPETRVGPQDHALDLSQTVPWAGKRRLQAQHAEEVAGSLAWRVQAIQRQLTAEFKNNYFNAAYVQAALVVNREEMELLRRFEEIALTRYATGEGIQQSAIKVQTDLTRLADREISLKKQLDIFTRKLSGLMGNPEEDLSLEPVTLSRLDLEYDAGQLEEWALAHHPSIQEIQRLIHADELGVRRQTLESRPDFRFGLSYTDIGRREDTAGRLNPPDENGKDSLALLVSVNLPFSRKRIRAGVAEAREQSVATQQALAGLQDQLRYLVQEAVLRLESTSQQGRLYSDVLIPQAEESLASAEAAYATNRLDFLDLLDAERILFQVRLTHKRLLADSWIALADLEQVTGRALPGAGPPPGETGHQDPT